MTLENLLDAHWEGRAPEVPAELREDFDRAVAAHAAIAHALGETVLFVDDGRDDGRPPPALPEDYEIIRELGRGGMGVVYLARQRSLDRLVAVKVLRPGDALFAPLVRRFTAEARHLARLRHPNIVSVHQTGESGREPWFVMDYVEGEPLSALLARGALPPTRALDIVRQAAAGVEHAHRQGVIHRDLKPGNILLDLAGRAYVTDFGLARDMTRTSELTHSGEIMGTPAYMAPEQARGEAAAIGEATDVHALGAILYEALTGRAPYGKDSPAFVLVRLLNEEPAAPRKLDRRIPRELETICLKALAKRPQDRYAAVSAFREDLARFESGVPVVARGAGAGARALRFLRRRWRIAVAAGAIAAAIALAAAGPWLFDRSTDELIAHARERRAAGETAASVSACRKALASAGREQRVRIRDELAACVSAGGDPAAAMEAAMLALELDPAASFGAEDLLVAKALLAQAPKSGTVSDPDTGRPVARPENVPLLERARRLTRSWLDGGFGSEHEQEQARAVLAGIEDELGGDRDRGFVPAAPPAPKPAFRSLAELDAWLESARASPYERCVVTARTSAEWESQGEGAIAAKAALRGFRLLKQIHPFWSGLKGALAVAEMPDAEPCQLLRELHRRALAADPALEGDLAGGVRIRTEGEALPDGIQIGLRFELTPAGAAAARRPEVLGGVVLVAPFRGRGPVEVGIADGSWRLRVRESQRASADADPPEAFHLLHLDLGELPDSVDIRGSFVDLPPVRARLLRRIDLAEPKDSATVDLRQAFFRWSEVPGATRYRVSLGSVEPGPGRGISIQASFDTTTPRLCLGVLGASELDQVRFLERGVVGIWSVEAADASGRPLGKSGPIRQRFVVAHAARD